MIVLKTNKDNLNTIKIYISSLFGNANIQTEYVEVTDIKDSIKRLPLLILENGIYLFSPNTASKYLFPPADNTVDRVNQILEWEATNLLPCVLNILTSKASNSNKRQLQNCLKYLENNLNDKQYLITDNITVTDIVIFSSLYVLHLDKQLINIEGKIQNWFQNVFNNPLTQKALQKYPLSTNAGKVLMSSIPAHALIDFEGTTSETNENSSTNSSPSHQASSDSLTPEELQLAKSAWLTENQLNIESKPYPILPKEGERNILITSALPYVNNVPHLGNIIGCVLSADVFSRYCRLCNYNTLFICGTDEYGTATETKALAEGLTPQQICDKYFQIHNDIYRWFGIGFDYFGRTTTPEQTEICQEHFLKLNTNGFISTQSVDQLYCGKCERFLADRFVEGGCPHVGCTYEDARGDQCDGCGKLVNAIELKNPRCKLCSSKPTVESSEQFFFDLPKIEPMLKLWMQGVYDNWSYNAKVIGASWLKEGLKARCITRDLKWGIPVPFEKYKNKVFYVWFDAPFGYMSITKRYAPKDWKQWWCPQSPKIQVDLFQFMAKDNVPFHSVMFPATLLAINEGHTKVKYLMSTEYLNYEDGKFSKSRGVGVFGNDARDTGIPADVWRFYLLYIRPETQDSSFSWIDLATKNNSELLNNLGNFINRALVFCEKFFNSTIPNMELIDEDITVLALCNRELKEYVNSLEKAHLRDGIRHILAISRHGNQYMQANQPWVLVKGSDAERARAGTVIGISCNLACLLMILLQPYMPQISRTIKQQLNAFEESIVLNPSKPQVRILLPTNHKIGKPAPLFSKIEPAKIEELRAKYGGVQNEEVKALTSDIEMTIRKQEDKINALKSKNASAQVLKEENTKLLELKKQLKETKKGNVPKSLTNGKTEEIVENGGLLKLNDNSLILKLESEISQLGNKIRTLKANGADKSIWQAEVSKLLSLKSQLTAAGGVIEPPSKSGKSKTVSNEPVKVEPNLSLVTKLETEISELGNKIRTLKTSGADKSVWQPEVTKLLSLKSQLVAAGGVVAPPPKSGKSKTTSSS